MTDIYAPNDHDSISAEELELYQLIMEYRVGLGLDLIPLSNGLSLTAGRHVVDTRDNIWGEDLDLPEGANLHSWSDAPYFADHSQAAVMWDAPVRLDSGYTHTGFEISAAGFADVAAALEGWKSSAGHNAILANLGIWEAFTWNAIGIGVETSTDPSLSYAGRVFHVWFGREEDASGSPQIIGSDAQDTLSGTAFNDLFQGSLGADIIAGGAGTDGIDYSSIAGAVEVYLNANIVRGAAGEDIISGIENLIGSAQDDRLVGDSGDNHLSGGDGRDILKGKGGNDLIDGGAGDDVMRGGNDADVMNGGAGSDILVSLAGADVLFGNEGRDFVYGGRDDDQAHGGAGDDEVRGNLGNDTLTGGDGQDDLRGGSGNDSLSGDAGRDFLFGGQGADTVSGGAGDDVLTGGAGSAIFDGAQDTFVYASAVLGAGGYDRIKDWENGIDQIDLTAFAFTDFDTDVATLASDRAAGLRIDFGAGDVLFIDDLLKADFDASDVILS